MLAFYSPALYLIHFRTLQIEGIEPLPPPIDFSDMFGEEEQDGMGTPSLGGGGDVAGIPAGEDIVIGLPGGSGGREEMRTAG